MILLDTNVVSDTLQPAPDERVAVWLSRQPRAALFTSTVTRAELLYGVRLLPDGRRRDHLFEAVSRIVDEGFAGRVLAFDSDAADAYADIASSRRKGGRPISQFDAMIAAIARSRGAVLATRNTKDFDDCGVDVTNPWKA
ncbi:MAG: type II toxin-antitoxin system VapC family toxin [Trueperaceae bacterium]|nr:type II toxin-antitoxin system VapC family toxin [Trueperaceae bacterium]